MVVRLIEKGLLLGLGVLTLTRDKVVHTVNSLVEEGEVKAEEAPRIVDRIMARGQEEREELRNLVRDELDKLKINMPMASHKDIHKDIKDLSQKIDELAARIDELASPKTDKK